MIENTNKIADYLDYLVNSVFKILPLYEEENVGLQTYIESLLFDLDSYEEVVKNNQNAEYIQVILVLTSLKKEVVKKGDKKLIVRREVFKCISIVKSMVEKLKEGE